MDETTQKLPDTEEGETASLTDEELQAAIEAVLFAAGHPVSFETLASALSADTEAVQNAVSALEASLTGRGVQLIRLEKECQLVTREAYAPYIRQVLGVRRGGNLSRASLETLAIIAYHQPVTRAYVDEVRGVDTGYVISSLADKGLIASQGRLDVPGRPTLYGTTDAFLRVFGLESLSDLPPAEAAAASEHPEEVPEDGI